MIFLNAFFAGAELVLVSLNENKVKRQADEGDPKSQKLYNLISEPSRFLSTIQIGVTLSGFLASAFAADFFAKPVSEALYNLGVPLSQSVLQTISVVMITIILSYFTLVFGELVPKQIALQKAEALSKFIASPLTLVFKITLPVVKLLSLSTNAVVRLFGVDPHADNEEATEEEIRMMVDTGGDKGNIELDEKLMINNVFEFNDKRVSDIITHRTDISMIPVDTNLKETVQRVNQERYTRFPVYEGDIDNIIGVFHTKDLIQFLEDRDKEMFDLRQMVRKPYFVLETQNLNNLFKDMQKDNIHIAIVLDEYGGTEGLVTIEDTIEEIVGEILSENEGPGASVDEFRKIDDHKYSISGTAHLHEIEDLLEVKLPTDEYETVNGFLIGHIGYFPDEGEEPEFSYNGVRFKVKQTTEKRIEEVIVTKENPEKDSDGSE
ncbi:hemolysin family protein [Lentibacillus jeotgali]|uniref:hemolysin family protein n=1 Tax=Lentibacillus jeotgali TaxID=558169 RepID=UPI0002626C72|nr:hemolysin family protein [Lentibacillus jeotgali]